MKRLAFALLLLSLVGVATRVSASDACAPLPPPSGNVVSVSTVAQLETAVNTASAHDTISIANGTYNLDGVYLWIDVPNVTLRSASGNREAVILDGNYITTEIIQIVASNVTIADLTLREALHHPIHVMSTGAADVVNTFIYNVHIIDPGQQAIKINPAVQGFYPDDGEIACSRIELTDAGRPYIWSINGSCYTGGVDAHYAWNWIVRDNTIEGFWCGTDLSEHAVHFWKTSRDTMVERNVLIDNARGVGFGLETGGIRRSYPDSPCPSAGGRYVDHYGGVVRNNFVFASRSELFASQYGFDCGICFWNACGAQALHNTVASTQNPGSSIEWRFDDTVVTLTNNLVTYSLWDRGGTSHLSGNLTYQPLSLFVDGPGGDLHLVDTATDAIDGGVPVAPGQCDDDIDGDSRPVGAAFDVGADEFTVDGGVFVLDGFGGVHVGGGASPFTPSCPYFGFDIAVDMELVATGLYVLDGFGGVHHGGSAPVLSPPTPYFGFDIARDLELAAAGFYVIDGFGGIHAGGGAPVLSPSTPYFGFDIAKDLELATAGFYVIDGFGGLHSGAGASVPSPSTPYFGLEIARDMELASTGFYVLDGYGVVHAGGGAPVVTTPTPYFGFDVARDLELASSGFYVLDGFGGMHCGDSAPVIAPAPPYFGFDIAKDLELR